MTLATGNQFRRKTPRSAGFTLLEMIIVLALIGLFTGLVVVGFGRSKSETLLGDTATSIRKAAHQASQMSLLYRRDFFVYFDKNEVWVSETNVTTPEPVTDVQEEKIASFPISDGVTSELRLAQQKKWNPSPGFFWRFRASGLCDPLIVRLSYERSFIELDFNVLTARAEETSVFQ